MSREESVSNQLHTKSEQICYQERLKSQYKDEIRWKEKAYLDKIKLKRAHTFDDIFSRLHKDKTEVLHPKLDS